MQADNGGEFQEVCPSSRTDSQYVRIPPAAHTYQSDVGTAHRVEEDEFSGLESFASHGEFLPKTYTYQHYLNPVRPDSHKQNLNPRQIIERLDPRAPLDLCLPHPLASIIPWAA